MVNISMHRLIHKCKSQYSVVIFNISHSLLNCLYVKSLVPFSPSTHPGESLWDSARTTHSPAGMGFPLPAQPAPQNGAAWNEGDWDHRAGQRTLRSWGKGNLGSWSRKNQNYPSSRIWDQGEYTVRGTGDPSALIAPVEINPQRARKRGCGEQETR